MVILRGEGGNIRGAKRTSLQMYPLKTKQIELDLVRMKLDQTCEQALMRSLGRAALMLPASARPGEGKACAERARPW
jgi:hypothetical protein